MVFSSIIFLFAYLPLALLIYHAIFLPVWLESKPGSKHAGSRHAANFFLLAASLLFYFWGEKLLIWVFVATVIIDYICAILISRPSFRGEIHLLKPEGSRTRFQKTVLATSITANLALLACFKYFDFGVDSYNAIVTRAGFSSAAWLSAPKIALPLGISFFVFHSMSYTIDVYRGYVTATRNLADYASFVLMFPQLVAGPIVRYSVMARQLVARRMTSAIFASGIARFVTGLSKKVLIANTVATAADRIFSLPANQLDAPAAWLGAAAYTLQIYFDFSGYSDMAIGLGRMLGFELPINFNYPYIALSMRDYWRRWHISLSTWFRDYLYIPLGGSRRSIPRTYANLITVFFLCGLWHGAKWTFVVWGLYHGFFLAMERMGLERLISRLGLFRHVYTVLIVMIGFVLFRSDTFEQAWATFRALTGFGIASHAYPVQWFLPADVALALIAGVIFSAPIGPAFLNLAGRLVQTSTGRSRAVYVFTFSAMRVAGLCAAMIFCAAALASGTHNPFIYFRF
jgi:alginate O-acetyltransferase complex protein AlgI